MSWGGFKLLPYLPAHKLGRSNKCMLKKTDMLFVISKFIIILLKCTNYVSNYYIYLIKFQIIYNKIIIKLIISIRSNITFIQEFLILFNVSKELNEIKDFQFSNFCYVILM